MSIAVGYNGGGNSTSSGLDERFKIDGSSDCNPVTPVQTIVRANGSASNTLQSKNVPNSTSKCASTQDNFDAALEVVYTWGKAIHDEGIKMRPEEANALLPVPLQCDVVLDAHHIACGVRHAALLTRQGQVFTWGHESSGDAFNAQVTQLRLLESLSSVRVGYVACGEFHTCAVTVDGELYMWGNGTHSAGLVARDTNLSQWMPKRVLGSLQGLQVAEVTSGPWHTALITTTGQLFTSGDGTFGVLGHGNRDGQNGCLGHGDTDDRNAATLVEALKDKRVKSIACGPNYCVAVCLHRMVNGAEQSHCSACRLAFGFTRKRHNCYNCGAVHCHGCSSRRAIGAALAPDPSKSCRVCDSCFAKLGKGAEAGFNKPRDSDPAGENKDALSSNRWFDSAATEQKLMPRKHSLLMSATSMLP